MRRIVLLCLFALGLLPLFAHLTWQKVDVSKLSWTPIDERDTLVYFYNKSIMLDASSYRYIGAEEPEFRDMEGNKVLYRTVGIKLPDNSKGCKISFTFQNTNNAPHQYNYKIAKVNKKGKEKEGLFMHSVYWGCEIRIDYVGGGSGWYSFYNCNATNYYNGSYMIQRTSETNSWNRVNSFVRQDVKIDMDGDKHVAYINGTKFSNVKQIGRINLRLGPAARLKLTDFSMSILKNVITKTDWTPESVRANIDANNNGLCGLYLVNDYTIGVVKKGDKYQMVMVELADVNKDQWDIGEIYATGEMTAVPGIVAFRYASNNERFYMASAGLYMHWAKKASGCFADDAEVYLKLYPSSKQTTLPPLVSSDGSNDNSGDDSRNNTNDYIAQGSGVILAQNGIIATNYHVVDGASVYDVIVKDGASVKTYHCKLLSTDKINDLALLQIDDDRFTSFAEIPYSLKTKQSEVGTKCYAYGYPMAQLLGDEVKVTDGIISSRTGFDGDIVRYQISVAITHGNSGGPLFDEQGNLIGITSSGVGVMLQNTNYAIKASYLRNMIDSSPIDFDVPSGTIIQSKSLVDQVKLLSSFVVRVMVK